MNTFEWCVIVVVALDIVAYSVAHKNELTTKGYVQRDLLLEPSPPNPSGFDKQDSKSLMQWILKIVDIIEKHCNTTSKPLYLVTTTAAYGNSTTDALNGKYKAITGKPRKSSLTNLTGKPEHAAIDTRGFHVRAKPQYTNKNNKSVHLQASMNKSREPSSTTVSHNGLPPTRRIKSSQESDEDALFDEYRTDPTDESQLYSTSQPITTTMSLEGAAFSQLKPGHIAGIAKPIHPSRTISNHTKGNSRNLVNKRLGRPNNRSKKTSKSYTIEKLNTFVPILTTLPEYTEEIANVTHTNVHDAASKPTKRSRYMIPSSGSKPDDNMHSTIVLQGTKPILSRKISKSSRSSAKAAPGSQRKRRPHYSVNKSTHMKTNSATTTNNLFHSTAHYRHTRPNLLKVNRTSAHFSRKSGSTHPYDLTDNPTFTSNSATITDNPLYSTIFYKEIADVTHIHIHDAANKSTKRSRYMIPSSGIKRDDNIPFTIVLQDAKPGKSLRSSAKDAPRPQRRRPPHHSANKSTHMKASSATTANNPSHSTAHYRHTRPKLLKVNRTSAHFSRKGGSTHPYDLTDNPTFTSNSATITDNPSYSTIFNKEIADITHTHTHDAANKSTKRSRYMIPSSGIKRDDNIPSTIVLQDAKPDKSLRSSAKGAPIPQRRPPHHSANKSTHMKASSATTTNNPSHATAHYRHTSPNLLKVNRTSVHFSRKGGSTHPYDLTDNPTFTSNSATITDNPSYSTIFYKEIADITHTHTHDAANKSTKRSRYMIPSSGIKRDDNIPSTMVLQGAKPGKYLRSSAKGAPKPQRRRPPHHSANKSTHMKANSATTPNKPSHSTAHYRHTRPNLLKVNRTSVHFSRKGGSTHPYDLTDNPIFTSNSATITDNPLYSTIFYKEIADITHTHVHDAANKSTKRYMIPSSGIKRDDNIPSTMVLQGAKPGKSLRSSAKGAPIPQRRRPPHHSANKSTHMKANSATTANNPSHSTAHYRHIRPSLLKVKRTSAHFLRKASSTHPHASTGNATSTSNPATTTDNPSYSTFFYKRIKTVTRKNSGSKHSSRKVAPQHVINERPHHPKTNRVNTSTRTSKGRKAIMEPTTMQSSTSTTENTAIVPRIAETNLTPLGNAVRGTRESTTTELSSSGNTFGIIGETATRDNLNDNAESKSADNTETAATVTKLELLKENTTVTDASTETGSSYSTNSEDIATTTATVNELNSSFATIPTATLHIRSPCEGKDPWSWLEIFGQEQTFHTKLLALGKKLKEKVALN